MLRCGRSIENPKPNEQSASDGYRVLMCISNKVVDEIRWSSSETRNLELDVACVLKCFARLVSSNMMTQSGVGTENGVVARAD
jgi:hypothetical protein